MADQDSDPPLQYRREEEEDESKLHDGENGKVKLKDADRRRDRASRSPRYGRYSRSRSPPHPRRRRRSRSSSSEVEAKEVAQRERSSRQRSRSRSPPRKHRDSRKFSRSRSRSPRSNRDHPSSIAPVRDRGRYGASSVGHPGFGGYPPHHEDFHPRNLPRHPPTGPFGDPFHGPPPPGDPYYYGSFEPFGGPGPYGRGPPLLPPRGWVDRDRPQQRQPPAGSGASGREGRRRDEGPPGISLLVRNISQDITCEDLHAAFSRIGLIKDVYIPRDYHSQQPKGFAFIEFATAEQAREAREEMDRFVVRGRQLEVVFAQERRKTPNEMRGRVVDGKAAKQGRDRDKGEGSNNKEGR
mmetsp:Transcript_4265/g.6311  ORF Transcript_4265/g.6311 Transcript_4265/m.6311 type:complete len:353 (+) Transcript_4265:118-1176(+)|eukprot:CAMPEP_0172431634 /NCGR_PEP_ID=MMETSP1064-20121228/59266_1 /TAXON_ID=202472 /ORGANISM="Aulacoseira subarctica , Strain CCAP 1002/5" /LENGTH=352 /DNA_ID=CAMNT_0013178433 /DNA_START=88 /DNA_END=1146 /DNA_ORIENTATION=+